MIVMLGKSEGGDNTNHKLKIKNQQVYSYFFAENI